MSPAQTAAIGVMIFLAALDGLDIMAISFAAPGIAAEWKVKPDVLGWVLSMELVGMGFGNILLGRLGDIVGRHKAILVSLVITAIGMGAITATSNIVQLSACRIFTGLGIGGMIASLVTLTAEFSNRKLRPMALALLVAGFPMGAFLGGLVIKQLLIHGAWRDIFYFGAAMTVLAIPMVWFCLPESPEWLSLQHRPNALERINKTLARFHLNPLAILPPSTPHAEKASASDLFSRKMRRTTALITLAALSHHFAFYSFSKWGPKLVVDMGHNQADAAGVFAYAMLGGVAGSLSLGLLATRFGVRFAAVTILSGAVVMLNVFGFGPHDLNSLTLVATATMFFCSGAGGAFMILMTLAYPPRIRATGSGITLGIGRAGAIIGPALTGYLLANGFKIAWTTSMMSVGSLLAIVSILSLRAEVLEGKSSR